MQHTISENVFAGNAMNRRLFYQYGLLLPVAQHGFVGQGLGKRVSAGAIGLIAPYADVAIPRRVRRRRVLGVRQQFAERGERQRLRDASTLVRQQPYRAEHVHD